MTSKWLLWGFLTTALIVSGCATTTPYNPFKIPEADVRSKVKVIALAPVNVPVDIDNPESVKAKFESLISAKLREAGFTVASSAEYAAIWKQMTEKLGGFFDPITGMRDEQKFKTVREHTLREVAAKTKADTVLDSTIAVVKANFNLNMASWHGTTEVIVTGGAWSAFFAPRYQGTTGALSLFVGLSDLNGVDMYFNAGGLQLLTKVSGTNFVSVPRHELLINEERNQTAVNVALGPFLGKTTTSAVSMSSGRIPQ